MIDTDKYEGTNWDLRGQFTHTEMADEVLLLLAEVERLREQLENCKRQIKETADFIRDRGEGLHATDLDNFLEWME